MTPSSIGATMAQPSTPIWPRRDATTAPVRARSLRSRFARQSRGLLDWPLRLSNADHGAASPVKHLAVPGGRPPAADSPLADGSLGVQAQLLDLGAPVGVDSAARCAAHVGLELDEVSPSVPRRQAIATRLRRLTVSTPPLTAQ